MAIIKYLGKEIPILGVCLGHQAIGTAFGATVSYATELMHGKQSNTTLYVNCPLFANCPPETKVARYHSLMILEDTMPDCLQVTALTLDGEIMEIAHKEYPIYGLQFHPESIMTKDGMTMLRNFIQLSKEA